MRLQEMITSRRFAIGAVLAAMFVAATWLYALNSLQYKQTRAVVESQQLSDMIGRVRFSILMGFNISSVEGRSSTISWYVFGERDSGYLRVSSSNGERGPMVDSASFRDRVLRPPFVANSPRGFTGS